MSSVLKEASSRFPTEYCFPRSLESPQNRQSRKLSPGRRGQLQCPQGSTHGMAMTTEQPTHAASVVWSHICLWTTGEGGWPALLHPQLPMAPLAMSAYTARSLSPLTFVEWFSGLGRNLIVNLTTPWDSGFTQLTTGLGMLSSASVMSVGTRGLRSCLVSGRFR